MYADAHNHLGIASLDARKLKDTEQHFRAAVDWGRAAWVRKQGAGRLDGSSWSGGARRGSPRTLRFKAALK